jgi:DNA-binding NarL/FixJ family response regulator
MSQEPDEERVIFTTQPYAGLWADGEQNPPVNVASARPQLGVPAWPDFLKGQPGRPVRVLLVDDDPHIRKVVANHLLADLRIELTAQACSLREGKRLLSLHEIDVLLVDLNLGDGSGLQLIEYARLKRPGIEAVVISAMEDEHQVLQAFRMGANGYLLKNSWFGDFPQAVLQVVNGGASITPNLARRLLLRGDHRSEQPASSAIAAGTLQDSLSEREIQILKMVACGYTSAEVGVKLEISRQTVDTHIKNVYRKLRVRSRAQAVNCAALRGFL